MEGINDPLNLVGISELVNDKHLRKDTDKKAEEDKLMGVKENKKQVEVDAVKEFERTIRDLSADIGVDLDEHHDKERGESESGSESGGSESGGSERTASSKGRHSREHSRSRSHSPSARSSLRAASHRARSRSPSRSRASSPHGSSRSSRSRHGKRRGRSPARLPHLRRPSHSPSRSPSRASSRSASHTSSRSASRSSSRSQSRSDSRHRNPINDAFRTYAGRNIDEDLEYENDEDLKNLMLDDIEELRAEMESADINLKRIPTVDSKSSRQKVEAVRRALQRKFDRNRCDGFGRECILALAQVAECFFDGKRKLGPYSPDLTGWHNTVRSKLHRMRYETSTIMSNMMNKYNIGPFTRMMIELLPSAFVYSSNRKGQREQANYTADQVSEAYDELRQFE